MNNLEQEELRVATERAQAHANLHSKDYTVMRAPWGLAVFSSKPGDEEVSGFVLRVTPTAVPQ